MASKRSATARARRNGTSPQQKQAKRKQRMLQELHIDGLGPLRNGGVADEPKRPVRTRKFNGISYEVVEDGSWATTTGELKRPAPSASATPKRARKASQREHLPATRKQAGALGKRKASDDEEFLEETIRQAKRIKLPEKSAGHAHLQTMLPYLESLQSARSRGDDRQKAASKKGGEEMRMLGTQEARDILRSTDAIDAPIFLTRQSIPFIETGDGADRPIEQVFDWLPNPDEQSSMYDFEANETEDKTPERYVPISEIRARFLDQTQEKPAKFPWNFPELTLPASIASLPSIFCHPSCNLLGALVRYLQTLELRDVCTTACRHHGKTAEDCPDHLLTSNEVVAIQRMHQHWAGTVMIAEAGAMTEPHCDTFGFGTYICCGEGEIGLAWKTNDEATRKQHKRPTPKTEWAFKVLRRGDAVYLDPGRWHYVFRKPGGEQTMAWSVRVLRYRDLERWLRIMRSEVEKAVEEGVEDNDEDVLTWRGLLLSAANVVEQAKEKGELERFGGEKTVKRADTAMRKADESLRHLL